MDKVSEGKIGKYEILKVLGRGGMGEVLLAQDDVLNRKVAIKRPLKAAGEEGLARFEREARIAAALKHPNIPAVYDKGSQDDLPFLAMEFVEGDALDKIISTNVSMDLITKLKIIEQVCLGLHYAHQLRFIHRDIKPANIIVQPDGVAKIIDFGIAKEADSTKTNLTATSQVIGSLHYIAPERFKGMKVDGRSDLFSVGVMLFKLLTGSEPFTGGEATASYKIVNESHTPLSSYLHNYPPALDDIITKSLAKNPEDRYQTGEDFADDLHEV
ncbi:MAG TPA: serine/threonine-protein kinase, partial [Terracidiphilus sp.]